MMGNFWVLPRASLSSAAEAQVSFVKILRILSEIHSNFVQYTPPSVAIATFGGQVRHESMEKEIKWSSPEYHHYEKGVSWYWLVIIATILIVLTALWKKNFLFAVFAVIAAVLATSWGRRQPKTVNFTLSEQGLDIDGKTSYPYETLQGFALVPNPDDPELSDLMLHTTKMINPWLRIIVATQRAETIKALLAARIPEVEYKETITETLEKFLRF